MLTNQRIFPSIATPPTRKGGLWNRISEYGDIAHHFLHLFFPRGPSPGLPGNWFVFSMKSVKIHLWQPTGSPCLSTDIGDDIGSIQTCVQAMFKYGTVHLFEYFIGPSQPESTNLPFMISKNGFNYPRFGKFWYKTRFKHSFYVFKFPFK